MLCGSASKELGEMDFVGRVLVQHFPFRALYGRDPSVLIQFDRGSTQSETMDQLMQAHDAVLVELKQNLSKAQEYMKNCLAESLELYVQPEDVIDSRRLLNGQFEILVTWTGLPDCENSWELLDNFQVQFPHFHLEAKVNFKEGGIGERLQKVYNRKRDQWEVMSFKFNDSRRYRRIVGSIAGSCITSAIPLLASFKKEICLAALDIIEDGMSALAKVEAAYNHEKEIKEATEDALQSLSLYQLRDTLDATEEGADENRLLPAMNKIWPFLITCIQNRNPVAVRRCLNVISNLVLICGGDFFTRRFHTDGTRFWKLLTTSPFREKSYFKDEKTPLRLPYRSSSISSEDSLAETSYLKVQIAMLNMIADLCRDKRSAPALELVLKKVSGLVVGIACSSVVGLRDASLNALHGLASIDPDLVWLLLADIYYTVKKTETLPPPRPDLPEISEILPLPSSPREHLYVQYGGQSYGFEIDSASVEVVFSKIDSHYQMYS
ncbi:uncharacterized protein LOC133297238 [Gastrolobium bilobum]|uniref:uncharacterized protein LOC133297238 n=1 Tax=Gastrolobium bilobum TaxID=150636 RepID=UPI002AB1AFA9|nr:uncharacterized protein LOC133297238 [Gastrolobium bilobum]